MAQKITVKFLTPIKQPMKKQNNRKHTSEGKKNSPDQIVGPTTYYHKTRYPAQSRAV